MVDRIIKKKEEHNIDAREQRIEKPDSKSKIGLNNLGFTLSELLVVIAIMAILAGVSFVAVNRYVRALHSLEMDNTAKEIFIAAQNHLSQAYVSGEYQRFYEDNKDSNSLGYSCSGKPYVGNDSDSTSEADYRFVPYNGTSTDIYHEKLDILSYMLPDNSIDKSVAYDGNYIIAYEAKNANVIDVFYSGSASTFFGTSKIHEFIPEEAAEESDNKNLYYAKIKENRLHYLPDTEDSVIGWYGSDASNIVFKDDIEPLKLTVFNDAVLWAKIENPNEYNPNHQIKLIVTGKTSHNSQTIVLNRTGDFDTFYNDSNAPYTVHYAIPEAYRADTNTYTIALDDITDPKGHFYQEFKYLIPGEDVHIAAEITVNTDSVPITIRSEDEYTANSLYYRNIEGTAWIDKNNIRHLENLATYISNVSFAEESEDIALSELANEIKVTKAVQVDDISYDEFINRLNVIKEISYSKNTMCIFDYKGSADHDANDSPDPGYYGISNKYLTEYDGNGKNIKNLYATSGKDNHTGVFSEVLNGFKVKNLTVENGSFTGTNYTAALIGYSNNGATIKNCTVTGNRTEVSSSGGSVGGLVGDCAGNLKIVNSIVSGNDVSISTSATTNKSSGGLVGNCEGKLTINQGYVEGAVISVNSTNGTSGGIVGTVSGELDIDSSYAYGKSKCTVSGANNAGGIVGESKGGLTIENTYCSSYVFASANAGGFIGNISGGTTNNINYCYSSGHTRNGESDYDGKHGVYGSNPNKVASVENYNVISDGNAGGFIGMSSVSVSVTDSYTTCSAYSTLATGIVGGFIGNGQGVSVSNCYCTGLVGVHDSGTAGGFIGYGSITASGNNYFFKGKDLLGNEFNKTLKGKGDIDVDNIIATIGEEITSDDTEKDAVPWDDSLKEEPKSENKGKYPYKTIKQLYSGSDTDFQKRLTNYHYGDWPVIEADESNEEEILKLSLSNSVKLAAIITVPTAEINKVGGHYYASMAIEGIKSHKIAYMQLDLTTSSVSLIDKEQAITNITGVEGDTTGSDDIAVPDFINSKVIPNGDNTEFHIYLDDITTPECNFASLFSSLKAGEDIRVTVESGYISWVKLIPDGKTAADSITAGTEVWPIAGVTNSLFADGSDNSSYSESYYSDINPATAIVNPGTGNVSAYDNTALIKNFRHLQNVDKYISNVHEDYSKVLLCGDLYWNANDAHNLNSAPSGTDFITAIKTESDNTSDINIYAYSNADPITASNAFYGIINEKLREFNGNGHSIYNVLIYNGKVKSDNDNTQPENCASAGLFRLIHLDNNVEMNIHDLSIVQSAVISENGNAGGLIGNVLSDGKLIINQVFIYGRDALVRTLYDNKLVKNDNSNAGGVIGSATGGKYTISHCGSSSYVYADNWSRCAGGLIGDFKPKSTTDISFCFVGGHVNDLSQDYVDGSAVTEVAPSDINMSKKIKIESEGGYNICGQLAVGGFFGYIGTDISYHTTISDCFTTASVCCERANGTYTVSDCTAGGFVGRLQHRYQTYERCYVEGKVYTGTDMPASFVGHYYYKKASEITEELRAKFINTYVLIGENYNNYTGFNDINYGNPSNPAPYEIQGINRVESDSDDIINEFASNVEVITFNKNSDEFPYKDNVHKGTPIVFYGDWVEPETLLPIKLKNKNRLTAYININDKTKGTTTEQVYPDLIRDVTYIRVQTSSGYNNIFRVTYNGNVICSTERLVGVDWVNIYSDGSCSASIRDGKIEFYIDDISKYQGRYLIKINGSVAGEELTVYTSKSLDDVVSSSAPHDSGNSLFEALKDNGDGTYTAKISNSRNLENLDYYVSGVEYNITNVEQTDDIYWQDDGTYAAGLGQYNANTKPYLTELPNSYIYRIDYQALLTTQSSMYPLYDHHINEYDGKNHAIHGVNLGLNNNSGNNAGLFAKVERPLTIKNLVMNNPSVYSTQSSGVLVGEALSNIKMENVYVNGKINIYGYRYSGGVIGLVNSGNLDFNGVGVSGTTGQIYNGTNTLYDGSVGGLIGRIASGNIDIKNCFSSAYINGCGNGIGGFIGYIGQEGEEMATKHCAGTISNCYSSGYSSAGQGFINIIANSAGGIGGFIGNTSGNIDVGIQKCFSTASMKSNYPYATNHWQIFDYIGGFIGIASGNIGISNCYTIGYVNSERLNSYKNGTFAGRTDANAQITDAYYIDRFYNNTMPAIAFDADSGTVKSIIKDNEYDPLNGSIPAHILGSIEDGTLTLQENTHHHDIAHPAAYYPYKNWTDANAYLGPGTPKLVFFGDW
ncbi:MAG: type II secretion system protein [Lachnospiraceae bacterium]|jgi:prepilin-type N-terminal cleavage/methylation domain-containing protein|nr:type II secretion system protein [Lachnospiraceae bacterium]